VYRRPVEDAHPCPSQRGGYYEFSDLERAIPQASQKMLTQHLRELERDGIVTRTVYPEVPPRVEYRLTDQGRGLRPVFLSLLDWADARDQQKETPSTE
jgi:DNA-binding HxlR family transcriptional regulator